MQKKKCRGFLSGPHSAATGRNLVPSLDTRELVGRISGIDVANGCMVNAHVFVVNKGIYDLVGNFANCWVP